MAVQPVRVFGDPVLRTRADEVTAFDDKLASLVADMMDTMDHFGGAGLAAPQIGVLQRVFVFDCGGHRGHIVNPEWRQESEDTQTGPEGCLSIPGIQAEATRFARVTVVGKDVTGADVEITAEEIMARCIQHETDHLDGVLFLSRLTPELRKAAMRAVRESRWYRDGALTTTDPGAYEHVSVDA